MLFVVKIRLRYDIRYSLIHVLNLSVPHIVMYVKVIPFCSKNRYVLKILLRQYFVYYSNIVLKLHTLV